MAEKQEVEIPSFVSFTKTWHTSPYNAISPTLPSLSTSGKNIVITGGGTGIGKAIAIAFASANATSITILGRREDRLRSSVGAIDTASAAVKGTTRVGYEIADLMKRDEVEKAIGSIAKQSGPIDVFVSNAGAMRTADLLMSTPTDDFMDCFDMNVRTAFNAVQVFMKHAAPKALVISISSAVAHVAPMPTIGGYAASKAANLKMMDFFAKENEGVRFVSLQPGLISTEINEGSGVVTTDDGSTPFRTRRYL